MVDLSRVSCKCCFFQLSVWYLVCTSRNYKTGASVGVTSRACHVPRFTFLLNVRHGSVESDVWHQVEIFCIRFQVLPYVSVVWEHSYLLRHWKVRHLRHSAGRRAAGRLHNCCDRWVIRVAPHSSNTLPLFNGNDGKALFQCILAGYQSRPSCSYDGHIVVVAFTCALHVTAKLSR